MRTRSDPSSGPTEPSAEAAARRLFRAVLAATLVTRTLLAAAFPVIGDEAYLFTWAREPAWGYYDHPPLAAWLVAPFFRAGLDAPLWLRLPSVVLYALLALVLVRLLRPFGAAEAWLGGALFLLLPAHVVGVLMVNDVALVLCAGLAVAALFATVARGGGPLAGYAATGALLGLALLAKYLAALLAAAFAVWFLTAWRGPSGGGSPRRRLAGFALLVACAVPFVALHLAWNATHCWSTLLYNHWSRHAGESKNYSVPRNVVFFALAYLYVASPPVLWYLARGRRRLAAAVRPPAFRAAALSFLVPAVLLAAAAATVVFGAYWVLPFVFPLFLLVPRVLDAGQLRRSVAFLAVVSGLHVAVLGVALALPLDAWRRAGFYDSLVTMERTEELLAALEAVEPAIGPGGAGTNGGTHLVAPGYSLASLLSYRRDAAVPVFGEGSHYGRQDDLRTDFRELDGDDVLMVSKRPISPESFDPYFRAVERRRLELHGVTLHLATGRGFRFERYREGVLAPVRDRYYRPPAALPDLGCPFTERYFPGAHRPRPPGTPPAKPSAATP